MNKSSITMVSGLLIALQSVYFCSFGVSAGRSANILSLSRLGDTIEDGVGYGGVRVGGPEAEFLVKWGPPVQVTPGGAEKNYLYPLDSGELVSVRVKDGKVVAFLFLPTPRMSLPSKLKTIKGIALGTPFETVRKTYGNPDAHRDSWEFYSSLGIGFHREGGLVAGTVIFQPGDPPK